MKATLIHNDGWGLRACSVNVFIFCFTLTVILPVLGNAQDEERDPFRSNLPAAPVQRGPVTQAAPVNVTLEGISIGGDRAFAVMNGEVFYENELKNGIKVTQIRKREVDIIINGVPRTLWMLPPEAVPEPLAIPEPVLDEESQEAGELPEESRQSAECAVEEGCL